MLLRVYNFIVLDRWTLKVNQKSFSSFGRSILEIAARFDVKSYIFFKINSQHTCRRFLYSAAKSYHPD